MKVGNRTSASWSASQALVLQSCRCVSVKRWLNQRAPSVTSHCRLGWFCCGFVTKLVTCWAGQGSGTAVVSCLMAGTGTAGTVGALWSPLPGHPVGSLGVVAVCVRSGSSGRRSLGASFNTP